MRRPFLKPFLLLMYAFLMLTVFVAAGCVLALFRDRRKAMQQVAVVYFRHLAALWGVTNEVDGWDELPADIREGRQPVIYIANHTSYLDAMMLTCNLPNHPVYLAKIEMLFIPVLGLGCWVGGCIFINRHNRPKAIASMKRAARLIHGGATIAAFPEGTRTKDGQLQPARSGIGLTVIKSTAPVVPVRVFGTFEAYGRQHKLPRPYPVAVRYGKPLDFSALRAEAKTCDKVRLKDIYQQVADEIMAAIGQLELPAK